MLTEMLLWAAAALLSLWATWRVIRDAPPHITVAITWLSLGAITVTFFVSGVAPGTSSAMAFILFSACALALTVTDRDTLSKGEKGTVLVLASLSALAAIISDATSLPLIASPNHNWLYGIRNALAAYGAASMFLPLIRPISEIRLHGVRSFVSSQPMSRIAPPSTTLLALTGACIAGGIWNLSTQATIWHAESGDAWLLILWLLVAAEDTATAAWDDIPLASWARLGLGIVGASAAVLVVASMPLL